MSGSHDGSATQNGSEASNDSVGASDLRDMTLDGGPRPASPAKRSAAEIDGEAHDSQQRASETGKQPSSSLTSPLPSRTKPSPLGHDGPSVNGNARGIPSVDEQVQKILPAIQYHELLESGKAYLVPMSWLDRLRSRTTEGRESHEFSKEAREGEIGPIDTRVLVPSSASSDLRNLKDGFGNDVVPLKLGLQPNEDYEFFTQDIWDLVMDWYGLAEGAPIITRFVRDTTSGGEASNHQYELYPPIVTVQKIVREQQRGLETIGDAGKMAARIVVSRSEKYQQFLRRAKQAAGIDPQIKVRAWKILEPEPNAMPTPQPSRGSSPAPQVAPVANTLKLVLGQDTLDAMPEGTHREELRFNDETANDNYNGSLTVSSIGFNQVQTIVLEEQPKTTNVDKNRIASSHATSSVAVPTNASNDSGQGPSKSNVLSKVSHGISETAHNRGRLRKKQKSRGSVGLTNLGNTCYMNSALQCLRSVEELTEYFLQQAYFDEINASNPLGSKGQVAKAYGGLIHTLYNTDSGFAPRNFKQTMSRLYPIFSGYGQQDSQEFVSSLLDGLHEDLNRIYEKPYIENPDSNEKTVGNPKLIQALGEQYQQNFRKRNKSVVIDLFNGWYKSTLVCPSCDKVSITFDPFSQVTLQLPIENHLQFTVTVYPVGDTPRNIRLDIDKNASIKAVKEYCAKRLKGVKAERLVMAETYNGKFFRIFSDGDVFAESLASNDKINVYELDDSPTNWPPLDKKHSKRNHFLTSMHITHDKLPTMAEPFADKMAVPVIPRVMKGARFQFPNVQPFFIMITRREAKDSDLIFRKVLARLDNMTTRDLCSDSEVSVSPPDDDATRGQSAGKSDERKVEMHSADDEDGFVDVSLTKQQGNAEPVSSAATRPKSKLLDQSYFIDADLRRMFEVCVHSGTELIASGYSSINETTKYPKLDDRMSRPPQRRSSPDSRTRSPSARSSRISFENTSDIASDDELTQSQHSLPDLVAQSQPESEDDADIPMQNGLLPAPKPTKAQGLKDKFKDLTKKRSKSRGEEYVFKLGETLVLDFTQEGYDQLFGGDSANDFRGMSTEVDIPTVPDPEADKRRERRAARKKAGVSLDDCFDESAKSEILSEDNAWYCSRCKELRRATKTLELWSLPDILVVHLKRFTSGGRFGRDKVDVLVDFPTEGLNLNSRVGSGEHKDLVYDLFAVDNHMGGLGGGHYTAYAKNFVDKLWYEYNDSFVSKASPEAAITRSAYLLFYRRRSDKPLGPPLLQELVMKAHAESRPSSPSDDERRKSEASSDGGSASDTIPSKQPVKSGGSKGVLGGSTGYVVPPVDEGLGLDEDDEVDNPLPSIEDRSKKPAYLGSIWSFNGIDEGATAPSNSVNGANDDSDTLRDDNASDQAGYGSDRDAKMEDFADEAYLGGGQMEHMPPSDSDPPVHNIHLSEEDLKMGG